MRKIFFLLLLSANAFAAGPTVTITNTPIARSSYAYGETIDFKTQLQLVGATSGTYHVEMILRNTVTGTRTTLHYFYSQTLSSTPLPLAFSYRLPASLPSGTYLFQVAIWTPTWGGVSSTAPQNVIQFMAGAVPSAITSQSGHDQGCTVGKPASKPLFALVKGSGGTPLSGVKVNFAVLSGGGAISASSATTDASGLASVTQTCGPAPGDNSVSAQVEGNTALTTKFTQIAHRPIYQPAAPPPASVVKLKPRLAGLDPLSGNGFIPDQALNFREVFSDEFNGSQLDTSKWWTRLVYSGGTLNRLNDECETYNESNTHQVANGLLALVARPKTGTPCPGNKTAAGYTQWDSGMIRSRTILKYGYFEARVRFPLGVGVWPAFWINPEDQNWPPEIDIFEFVLNGATEWPDMIHTGVVQRATSKPQERSVLYSDPKYNTQWGFLKSPVAADAMTADYHVVSSYWASDDTVTTYLDGVPFVQFKYKWVHDDLRDAGFAHILLNLAMGGQWPTSQWTSKMTTQEQRFLIDYVRVYQTDQMPAPSSSSTGKDLCPVGGGC